MSGREFYEDLCMKVRPFLSVLVTHNTSPD